jgi:hypothetical protein
VLCVQAGSSSRAWISLAFKLMLFSRGLESI